MENKRVIIVGDWDACEGVLKSLKWYFDAGEGKSDAMPDQACGNCSRPSSHTNAA